MKLPIYDVAGKLLNREIVLDPLIFGIEPHEHSVYLDVKHILANKRQGTHKSKEKSDVSGSTRKIKKQKGTGGARAGSIKSPLFRGGARIFGPKPRDYSFKLNKKVTKLARKSVLSYKAKSDALSILDNFSIGESKTKSYIAFLHNFGCDNDVKSLLVVDKVSKNLLLASRNISNARVLEARLLNTYDLLNADRLLLTESALPILNKILL